MTYVLYQNTIRIFACRGFRCVVSVDQVIITMPKISNQTESVRSNPFITKSISKTLLTPCRQIGLSRKRKTPSSDNLSQSGKFQNSVTSDSLNTTPLSSYSLSSDNTNQTGDRKVASGYFHDKRRLINDDDDSGDSTKTKCPDSESKQSEVIGLNELKEGDYHQEKFEIAAGVDSTITNKSKTKSPAVQKKKKMKSVKDLAVDGVNSAEEKIAFDKLSNSNTDTIAGKRSDDIDMGVNKNMKNARQINNNIDTNTFTKSISKTLLTPCRQVGLSRKRKTPISDNLSQSGKFQNPATSDSLNTTPLSSNSLSSDDTNQMGDRKVASGYFHDKRQKTRVSKRLIEDDDDSGDTTKTKCPESESKQSKIIVLNELKEGDYHQEKFGSKLVKVLNKNDDKTKKILVAAGVDSTITNNSKTKSPAVQKNKKVKSVKDLAVDGVNSAEEKIDFDKLSNNNTDTINGKRSHDIDMSVNKNMKNARQINNNIDINQDLNSKIIDGSQKMQTKQQDKLNKVDNSLLQDITNVKGNCKMQAPKKQESPQKVASVANKKTKKIKRSLSLKKCSSDDKEKCSSQEVSLKECSVTICHLDHDYVLQEGLIPPEINLPDKIKNLEKQVKEKKKLLTELKQADIYKKKHDLKDLQELTVCWKTGCISALNDLLPQLQKHASIDMEMILKNLNVPKDIVNLSAEGDLI